MYGMRGARIKLVKIKHIIELMKPCTGIIILGLGISTKLAPLIPAISETALREIIRKIDSISAAKMVLIDGRTMRMPMVLHANATANEVMTVKAYLHLTKLSAFTGDE